MKFYNDRFLNSWCIDCIKTESGFIASFDDMDKEWGFSSTYCRTEQDAYVDLIRRMGSEGGSWKQIHLIEAMVELEILPKNFRLWHCTAILDGVPYCGRADTYRHRKGVDRMDSFVLQFLPINSLGFSAEAKALAEEIQQEAVDDLDSFEEAYQSWENSWIDGPQP